MSSTYLEDVHPAWTTVRSGNSLHSFYYDWFYKLVDIYCFFIAFRNCSPRRNHEVTTSGIHDTYMDMIWWFSFGLRVCCRFQTCMFSWRRFTSKCFSFSKLVQFLLIAHFTYALPRSGYLVWLEDKFGVTMGVCLRISCFDFLTLACAILPWGD